MRARHAMAIGSLQPEACTCGGRAEATVAHDVASAGRFAARGSAAVASEGGLPPTGVAASGRGTEAPDCASAAWCFTTLSRRRCAREGGAGPGVTAAAGRAVLLVVVCTPSAPSRRRARQRNIAQAGDATGHCDDVAQAATDHRVRCDHGCAKGKRGLPERGDLTALRQACRTTIWHRATSLFMSYSTV